MLPMVQLFPPYIRILEYEYSSSVCFSDESLYIIIIVIVVVIAYCCCFEQKLKHARTLRRKVKKNKKKKKTESGRMSMNAKREIVMGPGSILMRMAALKCDNHIILIIIIIIIVIINRHSCQFSSECRSAVDFCSLIPVSFCVSSLRQTSIHSLLLQSLVFPFTAHCASWQASLVSLFFFARHFVRMTPFQPCAMSALRGPSPPIFFSLFLH